MTEEKQQKFTSKVRRGLVWVYATANNELNRRKAESTTVRLEGFTASDLADVEAALLWISQNKEEKEAG
jgi:hypothetical protein